MVHKRDVPASFHRSISLSREKENATPTAREKKKSFHILYLLETLIQHSHLATVRFLSLRCLNTVVRTQQQQWQHNTGRLSMMMMMMVCWTHCWWCSHFPHARSTTHTRSVSTLKQGRQAGTHKRTDARGSRIARNGVRTCVRVQSIMFDFCTSILELFVDAGLHRQGC